MPTDWELRDQVRMGESLAHHSAICRGEYCGACDCALPSTSTGALNFQLCLACWPDPVLPNHPLNLHIWQRQRWSVSFTERIRREESNGVAYTRFVASLEECLAIVDKAVHSRLHREDMDRHLRVYGHATIAAFYRPAQYAALLRATRLLPTFDGRRAKKAWSR